MCGFIAQLVEHRTGIAEVMGSNPVEALIFFRLLLSSCLNWKIYCDDHTSLSSTCYSKHLGAKIESSIFYALSKSRLKCCTTEFYGVWGGDCWWRLPRNQTQCHCRAPQSALCICSRKWKAKIIVAIYFGTKASEFCLRIISFSSLESKLSFNFKDSEINFDRARSTTVKSLLWALRANIWRRVVKG